MTLRSRFAVTLVVLLTAMTAGSVAGAQQEEPRADGQNDVVFSSVDEVLEFIDSTEEFDGQFQPYIVPAAAFSSDGFDPDSSFFSFFGGFLRGNAANDGCVKAPVHLPDGATVVNLFGYLYDDDASSNITLSLRRKRNGTTDSAETMASVTTSGDSASIQIPGDTSITDDVISNPSYSYYLTACLGSSDLQINGAWIFVEPADDVFTVFGTDAQIEVTPTGPTAPRNLLRLVNFGSTGLVVSDETQASPWRAGTRGPDFEIAPLGATAGRIVLDRFLADSGETTLLVERNGATESRKVLRLLNNGPTGFYLSSDESGNEFTWEFATRPNQNFVISLAESGQPELKLLANGNAELAGTLTENSDRNAKTDIEVVDRAEILGLLGGLEISEWSYLDEPGVRHLGPMAQDFRAQFGLGNSEAGVSSLDLAGVCLAGVQGLHDEVERLAAENAELRDRLDALEARLTALED